MHQFLSWKPVECLDVNGKPVEVMLAEVIDNAYRGTLLSCILAMPKQAPLHFDAAIRMVAEKHLETFAAGDIGRDPGQYFWYSEKFVDWISSLGFHIEISGDEFENRALPSKLA